MDRSHRSSLAATLVILLLNPTRVSALPSSETSERGIALQGRVIAQGIGPVKSAKVICLTKGAPQSEALVTSTMEDGSFRFSGLKKGVEYLLRASHRDYRTGAGSDRIVNTEGEQGDIVLFLEPFLLKGIVLNRGSRRAVENAVVHCIRQGDYPSEVSSWKTREDGRFEFQPLDRDALYTLSIQQPLYVNREVPNQQPTDPPEEVKIDIRPIEVGTRYEFRTQWGATLSGRLTSIDQYSLQLGGVRSDSALFREPISAHTIRYSEIAVVSRPSRKKLYVLIGIAASATAAAIALAAR